MGCAEQGGQGLSGLGSQVFQVSRVCHTSLSMQGGLVPCSCQHHDTGGISSLGSWGLPWRAVDLSRARAAFLPGVALQGRSLSVLCASAV